MVGNDLSRGEKGHVITEWETVAKVVNETWVKVVEVMFAKKMFKSIGVVRSNDLVEDGRFVMVIRVIQWATLD